MLLGPACLHCCVCSLFSALPPAFCSNTALANQMLVNHAFIKKCEEQFGKAAADDIGFKAVAVKSISRMEGKLGTDHAQEDDPKAAANIDTVRGALTLRTVAELKDKYDALVDILQVCRVKNAWNAPPMKRKEAFHYCVGEHGAASQFVLFVCVLYRYSVCFNF